MSDAREAETRGAGRRRLCADAPAAANSDAQTANAKIDAESFLPIERNTPRLTRN